MQCHSCQPWHFITLPWCYFKYYKEFEILFNVLTFQALEYIHVVLPGFSLYLCRHPFSKGKLNNPQSQEPGGWAFN